jgi:phage shock protein E
MNRIFIVVLAVIALVYVLMRIRGPKVGSDGVSYQRIDPESAIAMIDSNQMTILVDVRTPGEFSEGHIKGAINIPNESIGSIKPKDLEGAQGPIIVYCRSGARSRSAAKKLLTLGYDEVYDLGGIIRWPYGLVR